ncbi:MAG: 2-hydroxyacid dehydrogenase [Sphaerochaetaceae bacterium]
MTKIAFFDTKEYDKKWFDKYVSDDEEITYFESRLKTRNAQVCQGFDVVIAFVNDELNADTIDAIADMGVKMIALRSAGFNNVDIKEATKKNIIVARVPAYSPYAVAEHATALLLASVRKLHHSYVRTREFNFSLNGLVGFDLHGKTMGIVGTGKIGCIFIDICKGFGMKVIAYDPYPKADLDCEYVSFEELCKRSDMISFHCPLTKENKHMVNDESIKNMKDGVVLINTSRGALVKSSALLKGLRSKKIGAAGLDVYEEEAGLFFEDKSNAILDHENEILTLLIAMPNVIVTSHQAFLTEEALQKIADTTLNNIRDFVNGREVVNRVQHD